MTDSAEKQTAAVRKRRREHVRVEKLSPQQRTQAGFVAFVVLIAARAMTPAQAYELALNMVKLKDRAALLRRRSAELGGDSTPRLLRRISTIQKHIAAISSRIVEIEGSATLKITPVYDGSIDLELGPNRLRLG